MIEPRIPLHSISDYGVDDYDMTETGNHMNETDLIQRLKDMSDDYNAKIKNATDMKSVAHAEINNHIDKLEQRLATMVERTDLAMSVRNEKNDTTHEKINANADLKFEKMYNYINEQVKELKERPEKSATMVIAFIGCAGGVIATVITLLSHLSFK